MPKLIEFWGVKMLISDRFCTYVSPLTFSAAICLFLGCISLEIRSERVISALKVMASVSFGVYLINVQRFFWNNVWRQELKFLRVDSVAALLCVVVLVSALAFCCFGLLEGVRAVMMRGLCRFERRIDRTKERIVGA